MKVKRLPVPSGIKGTCFHLGDHICHFYFGIEHLLTKIIPFVKFGIENNEKCVLLLSLEAKENFETFIGNGVREAHVKDALKIIEQSIFKEVLLLGSKKEIERIFALEVEEAVGSGYNAIRIVMQMETIIKERGYERVYFLESIINEIIKDLPLIILCEYPFRPEITAPFMLLEKLHTILLGNVDSFGRSTV